MGSFQGFRADAGWKTPGPLGPHRHDGLRMQHRVFRSVGLHRYPFENRGNHDGGGEQSPLLGTACAEAFAN